ncbi:MAG TPA: lantibiotic dehydratase, partial [Kofleriaceae bacterium]|nr:lantibiotic dehydratase [Kofleriaceae bacterium]
LEETFVRLTGRDASRNAGRTYAGRGIVFEDCRRDVEVVLGRPFLDRIGPPLALIEASARWFSHTIASRFRDVFERVYRALAAEVGSPDVDFIRYYIELRPHLTGQVGAMSPTVREVRDELQRRWAEVLALPPGVRRVELRAADLAPRVRAAFAAPGPGWPSAREHAPDLMIAAAGPEALARGDFLVVLGEVHTCMNTVTHPALVKEHPDPARLHRARYADLGRTLGQVEPRGSFHRGMTYSLSEHDLDVEFGDARSPRPRAQVLDVAGFVVTERDGRLWVRRRDGSLQLDPAVFFDGNLTAESHNFDMFGAASHRPRVTVDGFVLARERWCFETAALPFIRLKTPLDRFVGARRWAAEHQLPRFTFVKARWEPKPVYLDLESPIFVELFCKLARSGDAVVITEMLPTFDQLWLVDAEGAAYCSEVRIIMVEDAAWTPP